MPESNYEDSQKSRETVEKEVTVQESMTEFFSGVEFGVDTFKTINGNEFTITGVDDGSYPYFYSQKRICQQACSEFG